MKRSSMEGNDLKISREHGITISTTIPENMSAISLHYKQNTRMEMVCLVSPGEQAFTLRKYNKDILCSPSN